MGGRQTPASSTPQQQARLAALRAVATASRQGDYSPSLGTWLNTSGRSFSAATLRVRGAAQGEASSAEGPSEKVKRGCGRRAGSAWGEGGLEDTPANSLTYRQGINQDNRARLFHSRSHSQMLEVTTIKHTALQRAPSRYCSLMQQDMLQTHSCVISWVEFPSLSVAFTF